MIMNHLDITIAEAVIVRKIPIAEVAEDWGISEAEIRGCMDRCTNALKKPVDETIDNAYLIHIEMHVGNDTRHLTKLIYAENEKDAEEIMANEKPDYRGNETPSYQLQIKGGPFKLTENLDMLEEY
jgi:hypothetical protein